MSVETKPSGPATTDVWVCLMQHKTGPRSRLLGRQVPTDHPIYTEAVLCDHLSIKASASVSSSRREHSAVSPGSPICGSDTLSKLLDFLSAGFSTGKPGMTCAWMLPGTQFGKGVKILVLGRRALQSSSLPPACVCSPGRVCILRQKLPPPPLQLQPGKTTPCRARAPA